MHFFLQVAISGVATGAIYGLIAVGYSLTFTTTKVLNFALGMWVMLGGMLTFSLIVQYDVHPIVALAVIILLVGALGFLAERLSVLPFLRANSDVWVMSTLAVGFLFIDLAEIIWGRSPTPVPAYLGATPIQIGPVTILSQQIAILVVAVITFLALEFFTVGRFSARHSARLPTAAKSAV